MFDWLFQNKKGEMYSMEDLITVDVKKLAISKIAIEKAVMMIAKAVAKSEIIVQRNGKRVKDHIYWMMNVQPNHNETATDFWLGVVRKLLLEDECCICFLDNNLYIMDSFTQSDGVMYSQVYTNVTIESNGRTIKLNRVFTTDEVMHLKTRNGKIRRYLESVMKLYDNTISSINSSKKMASVPKFSLIVDAQQPLIRTRNADGTEKTITQDQYRTKIKQMLESDDIEVITNSKGLDLEQIKIESQNSSSEITSLAKEVFTECAFAFDIPKSVFLGEITEKADSTNEFITYAVEWVVEVINDSMNSKLVGEESYLAGDSMWIDMSRFKHVDIIESAANMDKLRSIGFTLDEIRTMAGWEALNSDFSTQRVITKNYTSDLTGGDEDGNMGTSDTT